MTDCTMHVIDKLENNSCVSLCIFDYSKNIYITSTCTYNGIDIFHYLIQRDLSDLFNCKLMKTKPKCNRIYITFYITNAN